MLLQYQQVNALLSKLAGQQRVFVPAVCDGVTRFAPFDGTVEPRFDLVNTMLPPKDLLFPQAEGLYRYGFDTQGLPYVLTDYQVEPAVLFGIRSCDMRSIECLDDVFLEGGFVDGLYQAHRQVLLTVAIGCAAPAPTCFCDSMGLDPRLAPAADIQLLAGEDGYQVYAQSDKGAAALRDWQEFLTGDVAHSTPSTGTLVESAAAGAGTAGAATRAAGAAAGAATSAAAGTAVGVRCELKVDMTGVMQKLTRMTEHPIWEQAAKKCLTCGTCTFVCPTCYCFDISQENRMREGTRFRCWDSCMFSAYTEMAGGHNPRADKLPRVRQRFMHKLCFFEQRYGKPLCVGCGRCVEKCPVALDITVLIDEVGAAVLEGAVATAAGAAAAGDATAAAAPKKGGGDARN
jgi:ferredoxin